MSPEDFELKSLPGEKRNSDVTKGEVTSEDGTCDNVVKIETVELKKEMALAGGSSFIIGGIIGSGIFISPAGVLDATGSVGLSLCVWVGAGLISFMGALCYSELGTMIQKSGGEYSYIQKAFGNFPSFLYIWVSTLLMRPSSLATITLTCGTYMATLFPTCGTPELLPKLAAIACLLLILLLNCYSVRLSTRIQVLTTAAKVAALFVIIIGGILKMSQGNTSEITTGFSGSVTRPSTIALALYDALWAYDGWNGLNTVTEEVKNPSRNLPRAILLSLTSVIIIYCLTNLAYFSVMTGQEMLDADAVAQLWGDRVLKSAAILIPLTVVVSTFGASNSSAFISGRATFCAARDGNLPEVLSYIHVKQLTPLTSMSFTICASTIFVMIGDISSLIDFFSFVAWMSYGATFVALIYFRYKLPDIPRPYKVPIVIPVIMVLISVYLVVAPIVENPAIEYLYAIIFILGGAVFYFPLVHFELKIPGFDDITKWIQLIFEVVPTSKYVD